MRIYCRNRDRGIWIRWRKNSITYPQRQYGNVEKINRMLAILYLFRKEESAWILRECQ